MRRTVTLAVLLALPGCAAAPGDKPGTADACRPSAASPASRAGQQWRRENGWRYADRAGTDAAYARLVSGMSPWPDWIAPVDSTLPAGTRFQMAMAPDQPDDRPGGFGTFDRIGSVRDVREHLAVGSDWKPRVARVVVYEVTQPLPVAVGPIGPQVDPGRCRLLIGRWSQFQMKVPAPDRMRYLRVIEERPIR